MLALHVQLGILSITDFEPKVLVNLRHNVQTNLPRNMWKHVYVGLLNWAIPWDLTWLGGCEYNDNASRAIEEDTFHHLPIQLCAGFGLRSNDGVRCALLMWEGHVIMVWL